MTNSELLKKALEKAVKNGFDFVRLPDGGAIQLKGPNRYNDRIAAEALIFNHDFAKAFWGDEDIRWSGSGPLYGLEFSGPAWQWHLTSMVLQPEPLKYLERFLDKPARPQEPEEEDQWSGILLPTPEMDRIRDELYFGKAKSEEDQ